jgi:hypothetical protein
MSYLSLSQILAYCLSKKEKKMSTLFYLNIHIYLLSIQKRKEKTFDHTPHSFLIFSLKEEEEEEEY